MPWDVCCTPWSLACTPFPEFMSGITVNACQVPRNLKPFQNPLLAWVHTRLSTGRRRNMQLPFPVAVATVIMPPPGQQPGNKAEAPRAMLMSFNPYDKADMFSGTSLRRSTTRQKNVLR